jgi:hypothetical protein
LLKWIVFVIPVNHAERNAGHCTIYELLKRSQYGDEEGIEEGKEINKVKSTH